MTAFKKIASYVKQTLRCIHHYALITLQYDSNNFRLN